MLLALLDYRDYRNRKGRFSRNYKMSIMGGAFEGGLLPNCLDKLRPGDLLFIETFDSFLSWLVMYFTKSEISHVAFYLGQHRIAHATLAGVFIEPIEALYDTQTRILPCIWPMSDENRVAIEPCIRERYEAAKYALEPHF